MRDADLFAFIKERHSIYTKRQAGRKKPWTLDPILQRYRFCNVYRELDTVTQWIATNWRKPHQDDPQLWFAMVVARLLNWPPTLETLHYPVPWQPARFMKLRVQQEMGIKVFSGAYIVSTNGHTMDKLQYLAQCVLLPLWKDRKAITACIQARNTTLETVHGVLTNYDGLGSFMAAQVIADLKYATPSLMAARDWWTWAASGPGSRRGLNRVLGRAVDAPSTEANWLRNLRELHVLIDQHMHKAKMERLHAQDLQNCLCEFDKYERTRLGEGRPRSTYPGTN